MKTSSRLRAALIVAILCVVSNAAFALPIKEFRKFSKDDQSTYITPAVSMLAYTYTANGDKARGRCVQNWFFGGKGVETPGPRELAVRVAAYESMDPEKYHVEGVILGVTDKACAVSTPQPPKQ